MRNRVLAFCVLAGLAAGCAPLPTAPHGATPEGAHAPTEQQAVNAVRQWDVLAADVAAHVADRLRAWPAGQHPIHVEMAPQASDFQRGFRELLVTHLVERGIAVTTEPVALQLRASSQLVQHHAGAASAAPLQRLAEGVYVRRNATHADASVPMRTEVLVVTSLESEGRVLVRTSDVYTIAQPDAPLYQRPAAAPGPLTTWRVVP